jgi:hypothetical protein
MADSRDTTDLAARLEDHADAIENPSAHQLEADLRDAAAALREVDNPTPVIPKLIAELKKAALFSSDPATRQQLRALLGEAAQ